MNSSATTQAVTEEALVFDCAGETLLGVLARPDAIRGAGVLIVTGGPQYRAGSHRLFVTLARELAAAGNPVLRFDYRGMGDSGGAPQPFDDVSADIGAALDAFAAAVPGLHRFVLWGMCDGASASLLYLQERRDPRVVALALLNPWVRTASGQARTQVKHYYLQRLREREFWIKLASGKVAWKALSGLVRNLSSAFGKPAASAGPALSYTQRMAEAWSTFVGARLLMLSEHDFVAREFEEHVAASAAWQQALAARVPERVDLAGADHTCSTATVKQQVVLVTRQWMARVG